MSFAHIPPELKYMVGDYMNSKELKTVMDTSKLNRNIFSHQYQVRHKWESYQALKEAIEMAIGTFYFGFGVESQCHPNMMRVLNAPSEDLKRALVEHFKKEPEYGEYDVDEFVGLVMYITCVVMGDKDSVLAPPLNQAQLANLGLFFKTYKDHFRVSASISDTVRQTLNRELSHVPQQQKEAIIQAVATADGQAGGRYRLVRKSTSRRRKSARKSKSRRRKQKSAMRRRSRKSKTSRCH